MIDRADADILHELGRMVSEGDIQRSIDGRRPAQLKAQPATALMAREDLNPKSTTTIRTDYGSCHSFAAGKTSVCHRP